MSVKKQLSRRGSKFNILKYRFTSVDKFELDENDPVFKRLETVVTRLEGLVDIDSVVKATPGMKAFKKLIDNQLTQFVELSASVGSIVKKQSKAVVDAVEEAYKILELSAKYAQPNKEDFEKILRPLHSKFAVVSSFVPADRSKLYFHETTTISDSVIMFAWFNIFDPVSFTEEMLVGAQTYSNKVVQNCLDRKQKHVEWVRAWLAVLQVLCEVVKRYYAGGLRWRPAKNNPYPPIPEALGDDLPDAAGKLTEKAEEEPKKKKKIFSLPKKIANFDRADLLSEIANASRKLNLRHVPVSSRLT